MTTKEELEAKAKAIEDNIEDMRESIFATRKLIAVSIVDLAEVEAKMLGETEDGLIPVMLPRSVVGAALGVGYNEEDPEREYQIPPFYADYCPWYELIDGMAKAYNPELDVEELYDRFVSG